MTLDFAAEWKAKEQDKSRKHFKKIGADPESVSDILRLLEFDQDKKSINAALSLIGFPPPEEAITLLKALSTHSDPGIRHSAFNRVALTLKERGTSFYCDCLTHPKFREKSEAVYRIWRHSDDTAIEAMVKRLRQIINTRKGQPYCYHNGESEL
ncbi:MAG: hypothetical protein AAFY98_08610, partial [Verrucomicrobiota bacterium]